MVEQTPPKTPYDVLAVPRDARADTIRTAFRRAAKASHPDLNPGDPSAEQEIRQVIAAYNVLKNPEQRAVYDEGLTALERDAQARRRASTKRMVMTLGAGAVSGGVVALGVSLLVLMPNLEHRRQEASPPQTSGERTQATGTATATLEFPLGHPETPDPDRSLEKLFALADAHKDAHAPRNDAAGSPEPTRTRSNGAIVTASGDGPHPVTPTDPAFYVDRDELQSRNGDFDRAIIDFDEAIRLAPTKARAYILRGRAWSDRGDHARALIDFDMASRIEPDNPVIFRDRGVLWRRHGDLDRALVELDHAIRLGFSDAEAYNERGLVWYARKRYDRAIADFNQALKLNPHFASALVNRGVASRSKGDLDRAVADFEQAIRIDPSTAVVISALR